MSSGLRLLSAFYQGSELNTLPGIHDQVSYDTLARQILGGKGFTFPTDWWPGTAAGEPTAHWSFLYTLYLAGVYALFGPNPLVARLIQALVAGILYPWLAWRIGRRTFGSPVGLLAAGIISVYGYFVYYAGALMTETFYILAILWVLDSATAIVRTDVREERYKRGPLAILIAWKPWLLLGFALGTAVLLRQVFLLFVPFLFIWLLLLSPGPARAVVADLYKHSWRSTLARLALVAVVLVTMIAPWTVRNYQAFGRFVLLNTNSGYAFFWGNHPIHGTDFVDIFPSRVYSLLIPSELRGLDEAALDQALLKEGVRFVIDDPIRYARLSVSRVDDYFRFWPEEESSAVSNLARGASFGVMVPFILYGLFLSISRRGRLLVSDGRAVILLWLLVLVYSGLHLLSWALIRYRLPVDAVLIMFGALAIVDLWQRLQLWRGATGHPSRGFCSD